MSKGFSTMVTNICRMVGDSGATMQTNAGIWLNDAYVRDIAKRMLWSALVDDDKTFESVASQALYTISTGGIGITDFDEELAIVNLATGQWLDRMKEGDFWKKRHGSYQDDAIASGDPVEYVILKEAGKLKLNPPPLRAETYAIPHKRVPAELSGTTAPSIEGIEHILEYYGISMGWALQEQFGKADWYLGRYEFYLARRMAREKSAVNQLMQRISRMYRVKATRRLTGDASYDSI